jgi:hypothetical protein
MTNKSEEWTTIVAPEIIKVNDATQIRVEVKQSPEGRKGLSIRQWFRGTDKESKDKLKVGPWLPTKKGIWIRIENALQVHAALTIVIQNYSAKMQERF